MPSDRKWRWLRFVVRADKYVTPAAWIGVGWLLAEAGHGARAHNWLGFLVLLAIAVVLAAVTIWDPPLIKFRDGK